ncbi:MAG: hypothetical protein NC453_30905 [Muribaculum sp.]|nr:hypothetical protein [Muribaculum sp.]
MGKILIVGIDYSQTNVVKKLHEEFPEAKCISMTMGYNRDITTDDENLVNYDLVDNSETAKNIIGLGLMSGSEKAELNNHISQILEEQTDYIEGCLVD